MAKKWHVIDFCRTSCRPQDGDEYDLALDFLNSHELEPKDVKITVVRSTVRSTEKEPDMMDWIQIWYYAEAEIKYTYPEE
ncbi:MAG: hypothetical protein Q8L21_02885 [Candidatus Komeilibacteria bacterium]|nr:hypothetical protein [Candidatus Komeilibacteria bacterium]